MNMERSELEKINNNELFYILKLINKYFDFKYVYGNKEIIEDSDFIDSCDTSGRIVGMELSYPLDHVYLASTIQINPSYDFSNSKPSGTIVRPKGSSYEFDLDEFRTEYVRRTYKHEIISYSEDLVIPLIEFYLDDGIIDVYDGIEQPGDTYDSELDDIKLDKDSIRKIR